MLKTNPNVKLKREGINPSNMEKLDITLSVCLCMVQAQVSNKFLVDR